MGFKPGIFLLFTIFSFAYAAFNIQNCSSLQRSWIEASLGEVEYLASRATQTLAQVLSSSNGIQPQVQKF